MAENLRGLAGCAWPISGILEQHCERQAGWAQE